MPPRPVGGPQPSAAGRRGLPGCGEKELDVKIHYVFSKEIELVKKQIKYTAILKEYAFYLRNSARLPQISYMLAAVAEHLSERQRVMRSNR